VENEVTIGSAFFCDSSRTVLDLFRMIPNVTSVRLKFCTTLEFRSIAESMRSLASDIKALNVSFDRDSRELVELISSNLLPLPAELACWHSLTEISLIGAKKLVTLPSFVSQWPLLQRLDLSRCRDFSFFPSEVGCLVNLRELKMVGCSAQGFVTLPPESGAWVQLEVLDLLSCTSLQTLGDAVGNWKQLRMVALRECISLTGLPGAVQEWRLIQRVDLAFSPKIARLPAGTTAWRNLRYLDVRGCGSGTVFFQAVLGQQWQAVETVGVSFHNNSPVLPLLAALEICNSVEA
jgi:hypothetical protein